MRKFLLLLSLFVLALAASFFISAKPGVLIIRMIFDKGAATASAKLEKHLTTGVASSTHQYDPTDADAFLDVYIGPETDPDLPTVVWVHGGGFVSGRRSDIANYLMILAGQGFAVVNVDYTIAPGATYPAPVRQINQALAFLAESGAQLGINADRFVLAGDSAGAQIAAQLATVTTNQDYAQTVDIDPKIAPTALAGALLFCGVYDVGSMGQGGGILGWFVHVTGWAYSGSRNWRDDQVFATMSVLAETTAAFPPAFISAGNADPLAPQSAALATALQGNGVSVQTLFFEADYAPPLGHEYQFDLNTKAGQLALEGAVAWLRSL